MSNSLLWLDDEPETLSAIAVEIEKLLHFDIKIVPTIEEFLQALSGNEFQMILIDIAVPLSAGHQYPEDFLRFMKNENYAGSAALSYLSEHKERFGKPDIFVCSGHAPEFVNKTLFEEIAYQYVNKSLILLGPHSFIAELGFGEIAPTNDPIEPISGALDEKKIHDVRIRLIQISNVISSVTQSAYRMLEVDTQTPGEFDFEKAIRDEFDVIEEALEAIDAHKNADFIDDIDDLLKVAKIAYEKGFITSQSMIVEAIFEAIGRSRKYSAQHCTEIIQSLEKILHVFNYATISQQAAGLAYTASLLGAPTKLGNGLKSFKDIIEAEANSLQPEAASRNLEIRLEKMECDRTVPPRFMNRFRSAFYNVLNNAVKYNGQTGNKRTWVDIRLFERDQFVLVEIESWGEPLSQEETEFLTQHGYRGKNVKRLGFGLGLAIANEHVEAMGGELKFDVRDAGNRRTPRDIFTVCLVLPAS